MSKSIGSIIICVGISVSWMGAGKADNTAVDVLAATGIQGGLIVHLGCGEGRLTAELRASDRYLVHGLDADPANVDAARQHLASRGLLGPVSVDGLSGPNLPYADNLVNLLVSKELGGVPMAEVMRVLVPGGVAYIRNSGEWKKTIKQRPGDLDDWTHWLYDATGNAVAKDRVVGPPRRFQWAWRAHFGHDITTPFQASARMVSSGGRIFTIVDEGPPGMAGTTPDKWFLTARDAFNGIELWRKRMSNWGWQEWSTIWNERFNQPNNLAETAGSGR